MSSPVGAWSIVIATPIGKQRVALRFHQRADGLEGTATLGAETVPLIALKQDGNRLTWTQNVTRPLKLAIAFEVTFDDVRMRGTAKAGVLPGSNLEGVREDV